MQETEVAEGSLVEKSKHVEEELEWPWTTFCTYMRTSDVWREGEKCTLAQYCMYCMLWTVCKHFMALTYSKYTFSKRMSACICCNSISPALWQHAHVSSSYRWCTRPLQSWCRWPPEQPHSPPHLGQSALQFPLKESRDNLWSPREGTS